MGVGLVRAGDEGRPTPPTPFPPVPEGTGTGNGRQQRWRWWAEQFQLSVKGVWTFLGGARDCLTPMIDAMNNAKFPGWTVAFIVSLVLLYICWDLIYLFKDDREEARKQAQTNALVTKLTMRCVEDEHWRSCRRLGTLLDLGADFSADSPAPPSAPAQPEPAAACVCWTPGTAVSAVGPVNASALTVVETADSYAEVLRSLPAGALAVFDLHAAVRNTVDLNKDSHLSRYEVFVGLSRVVDAKHWHEKLADQLWTPAPCDCAPP